MQEEVQLLGPNRPIFSFSPSPRAYIGDDHSHQSVPDQESHTTSNSVDGGPIFSMYLKKAEEEDKRTAEGWKEEADKVFLFVSVCLPGFHAVLQPTQGS